LRDQLVSILAQQRLYFRPLPQGQGPFREGVSVRGLGMDTYHARIASKTSVSEPHAATVHPSACFGK
jgi:hypothetical protein